jgi:hypothetical protein
MLLIFPRPQQAVAQAPLDFDIKATVPRRLCANETCWMDFGLYDDDRIFGVNHNMNGLFGPDSYDSVHDFELLGKPPYFFDAVPLAADKWVIVWGDKTYLDDSGSTERKLIELKLPDSAQKCTWQLTDPMQVVIRFRHLSTIVFCASSAAPGVHRMYKDVISYDLITGKTNLLFRDESSTDVRLFQYRHLTAGEDGKVYAMYAGFLADREKDDRRYVFRIKPGDTRREEMSFSERTLVPADTNPNVRSRNPMVSWVDANSNLYVDMSWYDSDSKEQRFRLVKMTWTGQVLWVIGDDQLGRNFEYRLVGITAKGKLMLSREYPTSDIAYFDPEKRAASPGIIDAPQTKLTNFI